MAGETLPRRRGHRTRAAGRGERHLSVAVRASGSMSTAPPLPRTRLSPACPAVARRPALLSQRDEDVERCPGRRVRVHGPGVLEEQARREAAVARTKSLLPSAARLHPVAPRPCPTAAAEMHRPTRRTRVYASLGPQPLRPDEQLAVLWITPRRRKGESNSSSDPLFRMSIKTNEQISIDPITFHCAGEHERE
jgi:hypothetical protein